MLIDFPLDVLTDEYDEENTDTEINLRGYKLLGKANESQINKVADALRKAKKPIILAGGGVCCSDAVDEVREFVKMTNIPVVSTMMGLGVIPTDSDSYYGMIGSHGKKCANSLLNRSDFILALGTRLGDRSIANIKGLEKVKKLVHVDIDPAEIGKNTLPKIPVVGDIKDVTTQLIKIAGDYRTSSEWLSEAHELRAETKREDGRKRSLTRQ